VLILVDSGVILEGPGTYRTDYYIYSFLFPRRPGWELEKVVIPGVEKGDILVRFRCSSGEIL